MITGTIRGQIDAIWDAFSSGGISNPLEIIEQITYLLFLKRLDDLHTLDENKAARLKLKQLELRVFPAGKDPKGRDHEDFRSIATRKSFTKKSRTVRRAKSCKTLPRWRKKSSQA